ncbi:MAG TPA: Nif3-like dinuclear metal center hexameric protein [Phycisphaerales bacterium]|nr:Nif3-like dinuclear metal center hexameric protein [Phycisphaerales bacterium]
MVSLDKLVDYCNQLLDAGRFRDYAPNGLQVQGRDRVARLVTGVTASRALIEQAVALEADAILVHHGYFWKGEDRCVVGLKRDRLALLLEHGISLIAYHLPLDAHPQLGNNAVLARELELAVDGPLNAEGIGLHGRLDAPVDAALFAERLRRVLLHTPLHIPGGPESIQRIGWCTGAAQDYIEQAVALGLDAFVSGEVSERTTHMAREAGIHYYAAGHHATERGGVRALGAHLAAHFGLEHRFVDVPNPV